MILVDECEMDPYDLYRMAMEEGGQYKAMVALFMKAVQRVCHFLARCERLAHLDLDLVDGARAHELLAAVGAAVGGRLRSLSLSHAHLAQERGAAALAMRKVMECSPCLGVLKLRLCKPSWSMETSTATVLFREFLGAVPALAPQWPALREVWVQSHLSANSTHKATWLRPRA